MDGWATDRWVMGREDGERVGGIGEIEDGEEIEEIVPASAISPQVPVRLATRQTRVVM